jgi:hypothetical protein
VRDAAANLTARLVRADELAHDVVADDIRHP